MWLGRFIAYFLKFFYGASLYRELSQNRAKLYFAKRIFPPFAVGQTWGDIIFIKKEYSSDQDLINHEYAHVLQWQQYSIFFLPAYVLASVYAFFRYGPRNYYSMNKFEIEAREYSEIITKKS